MRGHASQALNGTFYDIGLSMFLYIVARFQSYGWTEGKKSFFSMSPPQKKKKKKKPWGTRFPSRCIEPFPEANAGGGDLGVGQGGDQLVVVQDVALGVGEQLQDLVLPTEQKCVGKWTRWAFVQKSLGGSVSDWNSQAQLTIVQVQYLLSGDIKGICAKGWPVVPASISLS